ncbi:unnamed protein product [Ambrosiozyma monospora]|uniref:Unnamed protein product n=1 Tax=Ambrosiozyma monospora TaxID=43982 RepID=A0ACB5ST07_AMBMO|nr:unnamed protein product [Ambrosiozyma monospora]
MLSQASNAFSYMSDNHNLDLGNCSAMNSIFDHLPWRTSMTDSIYALYNDLKTQEVGLGDIILKPPEPTYETIITSISSGVASVVDTTYFSYEISFDISVAITVTNSSSSSMEYTPAKTSSEATPLQKVRLTTFFFTSSVNTVPGEVAETKWTTTANLTTDLNMLMTCAGEALIYNFRKNASLYQDLIASVQQQSTDFQLYSFLPSGSSEVVNPMPYLMPHYYNLLFKFPPTYKYSLIDYMGQCYLYQQTESNTFPSSSYIHGGAKMFNALFSFGSSLDVLQFETTGSGIVQESTTLLYPSDIPVIFPTTVSGTGDRLDSIVLTLKTEAVSYLN